jgi:hypothetical protein
MARRHAEGGDDKTASTSNGSTLSRRLELA